MKARTDHPSKDPDVMASPSPSPTSKILAPQAYSYRAFGLTIASTVACPELLPQPGVPDVVIQYGTVPDSLVDADIREKCYEMNAEAFLLKIQAIARYLVLGGKEIMIEPEPGVSEHEVRPFLLGSALGAIFHQRGLLALHGCALEVHERAMVFIGDRGIGKSSLAGALNKRGYRVITDDISVLAFSREGTPMVQPSCINLKLRSDALGKMGKNPRSYQQVSSEVEKYFIPLEEGFCTHPRAVHQIYELAAHDSQDFQIAPLKGTDKLAALIAHTYRLDFLSGSLRRKRYFELCGKAARQISVNRLTRPRWPFLLDDLADLLEKEWG
jgi:hypothetical protein